MGGAFVRTFAAFCLLAALFAAQAALGARLEYGEEGFFGDTGRGRDELERPAGMAFSSKDLLAVAEARRDTVSFYDSRGEWLKTIGRPRGEGAVELKEPQAVAFDSAGRLWIADTGNDRVLLVNPNGLLLKEVGSSGVLKGEFRRPVDIAYGRGRIYVADAGNKRIQIFDSNGAWIQTWDQRSIGGGAVRVPAALAWSDESDGRLWLANEGGSKLYKLDMSGRVADEVELANLVEGAVKVVDLYCDAAFDRLFVCDGGSNRVLVVSGRRVVTRIDLPPGVRPGGLALAWNLDLVVSDWAKGRLLRFGRR